MTTAIETCANCGKSIGRLEQAYTFKEQVVCEPCAIRLNPPVASPPPEHTIATVGPLTVTNYRIVGPKQYFLAIENIHLVRAYRPSFSFSLRVECVDAVGRIYKYFPGSKDDAQRFINALRQANPRIQIGGNPEDTGWFIFWG